MGLEVGERAVLGRTHVVLAGVTWAALWWRPADVGVLSLVAPLVVRGDTQAVPSAAAVAVTLAAVALGALLPDLDHPRGWLAQRPLAPKGGALAWLHWVRPLLIPSLALREEFGHRGALHSLAAALAACLGAEYLARQVGWSNVGAALGWGYVLHLLADMATRRGVPLLYPLIRARWGLPRPLAVRTGGLGETLYLALASGLAAVYAAIGMP